MKLDGHLDDFIRHVNAAPINAESEKIVRVMLGRTAGNCPIDLLLDIARVVIDFRRGELRDEARKN